MIDGLITAAAIFALVEMAVRMPFLALAGAMNRTARQSLRTMNRRACSDHWKEKVLLHSAGRMLGSSLALLGCVAALGLAAFAMAFAVDSLRPGFLAFLSGGIGIGWSVLAAVLYLAARRMVVREHA